MGLPEDMRLFLQPSSVTDDTRLRPCRESIFAVRRRGRSDCVVGSQRLSLRRPEHGVIVNRAWCRGPRFDRVAFRSQCS
jgi:hypothetical protein